jgi:pyruvate/2-oxoglutarate dehydrogenase complex dihydrolipoamide dehydrogenase (E3) component
VTSIGTAGLGGRSAIIERNLTGGDCLNTGCVPSKALLKVAHEIR